MPKAKKLPSGSWTVLVYDGIENGKKQYKRFTAGTKAEVEYLAAQFARAKGKRKKEKKAPELTVRQAVEKYIGMSEALSPTTLSNYEHILKYGFPDLLDMPVKDLTREVMQLAVNKEAKRKSTTSGRQLSPKTVKNEYSLISSALKSECDIRFEIKLPQRQSKVRDYPEPDAVLEAIRGSSIELPCMLAIWLSFSLSEIGGLRCSDISKGYITINRVLVNVDGVPTVKENAKVDTRLRKHKVPDYIMSLIKAQENYQKYLRDGNDSRLIQLTRAQLQGRWKRISAEHELGLTFHGLRHMNASIMLMLGIPEKYAMERGGWKTPNIMKSVYQHTFTKERELVDDTVDRYFDKLLKK